ncbi:hypothetical protein [Spirulina sp. 06S082]|uniref:hypothetical protein n=1 Tax=Spirulina sp. 06S082 TaxID=3110248 RepID=UPI002B1F600A|nr:hypothetical protein [Spirulina sp. 06S082]MEA5467550.1 hypothetical protein [Spirulina sp. 06S082]
MTEQEKWYSQEERKLFLKQRYSTRSHHYFFEAKEAKNGSKYIVIAQRKKVGDKFVGEKIRIFEDEMLEFERILHNFIHFSLNETEPPATQEDSVPQNNKNSNIESSSNSNLAPAFFTSLSSTTNWKEFERDTYYLLKLLGITLTYNFLNERQAGKADGFFKIGNLAVIYDCTLDRGNIEQNKSEQINNYCNRLKQGIIEISGIATEEFYNHHKQVWIITQKQTRAIKVVNSIEVKEISVQDIMSLYQERLTMMLSEQALEMRLRNL